MFASSGERGEPCGMPRRLSRASVVRVLRPRLSVSSTGQSSHILIRCSTRRSTTRRATDFRRSECGMLPRTPPHTTHLRDFPRPVTILRERHPFEGRVLQALGAVHRRGVALLLVGLPDGSRSLIPAGWTDLAAMPVAEPAAATEDDRLHSLARLVDFLHAAPTQAALLSRVPSPRPTPAPTEESCRATDSGASRAARAAGNAGRAARPRSPRQSH